MATLILDIETVGEPWDAVDEVTRRVMTRWIDQTSRDEEEKSQRLATLKDGLGFSPLSGFIVALGVYDLERTEGTVYYASLAGGSDEKIGSFWYRPRSEEAMLQVFWEGALHYDTFVTFNGRAFDLPFILHRSVVCGVMPTVDLMRYRYLTQQVPPYHVDLQDQLTFYGAMSKRPSLHMFCRAYGITSPKAGGVGGDDVAALYHAKKSRDIALYNAGDLLATALLYEKWRTYLAPSLFRAEAEEIDF
jgi:3'-5' exonuclease